MSIPQLPTSPTIANIDNDFFLTMNWNPPEVDGGYTIYSGWDIYLATPPGNSPATYFTNGLAFGGTVSSPSFELELSSGDYTINMQAISSNESLYVDGPNFDFVHEFPPELTSSLVSYDNQTLELGQPLTITLSSNYPGSGVSGWQVSYQDGSSSGLLPISSQVTTKIFTVPGQQTVVVQAVNSFPSNNPPVKLTRSFSFSVFVTNQQYSQAPETSITGTLGVSGEQGFEIINNMSSVTTPQPYEVVVRSLVRDTQTNELKLLAATSRYSNASSLLGTMALDVFPLSGRPSVSEPLPPLTEVTVGANTFASPVQITTQAMPGNSYIGIPEEYFLFMQASGGITPYSWYSQGLPPGLEMSIDGTISGTPTQLGNFTVNVACKDSSSPAFIAETSFSYVIPSNLAITTASLNNATVLTPYSSPMSSSGGLLPFTWSVQAGNFPVGLSINPSTGVIFGIPCTYSLEDFSSPFTVTIQVEDAVGALASATFHMTLSPAALQFGLMDQPVISSGRDFRIDVPIFGGVPPYTLNSFTDDGAYSDNVNGDNYNQLVNGKFELQIGIATDDDSQNHQFTISVEDNASTVITQTFTYYVTAEVNSIYIPQAAIDHVWTNGDFTAITLPIEGQIGIGLAINRGVIYSESNFSRPAGPTGLVAYVNQYGFLGSPPMTEPTFLVEKDSFHPPAAVNSELGVYIPITQGTSVVATIIRNFELITHPEVQTLSPPVGFGAVSTYTEPYIYNINGSFVALDPMRPWFDSPLITLASGNYVRVQLGSSLPPGLSLDQTTSLVYGNLLGTFGTPTAGNVSPGTHNSSILEYVNASNIVQGTVTVYWDIVNSSFSIGGTLPQSTLGVGYRGFLTTGASGLTSASVYRGHLPVGLALSIPKAFSSIASGDTLTITLTASKLAATDSLAINLGPANQLGSTHYIFVWQGDNHLALYSIVSGVQTVVGVGNYVSWSSGQHTLVLTVLTGGTNTFTATFDGSNSFGGISSAISLASATAYFDYTGTSTVSTMVSSAQGTAPGSNLVNLQGRPIESGRFDLWLRANTATSSAYSYERLNVFYITPLLILNSSLPDVIDSTPYSVVIQGYGGVPAYSWSMDMATSFPALAVYLSLDASTGVLSGTATGLTDGQSGNVTFTLTDSNGTRATATLTITVNSALTVTTTNIPTIEVSHNYLIGSPITTLTATGGTESGYTWSYTGTLPTGITLDSSGALYGDTSDYPFSQGVTFIVTDSGLNTANATLNVTVGIVSGMSVVTNGVGDIVRGGNPPGSNYLGTLSTSGVTTGSGNQIHWSIASGTLPSGLSLSYNNGSGDYGADGTISGFCTAAVGTDIETVVFQADDSQSHQAQGIVYFNSVTNIAISTSSLPQGLYEVAYSATLAATGGGAVSSGGSVSYTWSFVSGNPPWLTLDSGTGALGGTPTATFNANVTFRVTDALSPSDSVTKAINLTITNTTLYITPTAGAPGRKVVRGRILPDPHG